MSTSPLAVTDYSEVEGPIAYTLWRSEVGQPPVRVAGILADPQMILDSAFPAFLFMAQSLFRQVPERLRESGCWQVAEEAVPPW